jgi:hypothetical protein
MLTPSGHTRTQIGKERERERDRGRRVPRARLIRREVDCSFFATVLCGVAAMRAGSGVYVYASVWSPSLVAQSERISNQGQMLIPDARPRHDRQTQAMHRSHPLRLRLDLSWGGGAGGLSPVFRLCARHVTLADRSRAARVQSSSATVWLHLQDTSRPDGPRQARAEETR